MKELINHKGINDLVVDDVLYHLKEQPETKSKPDKNYSNITTTLPKYFTNSTFKSALNKGEKGYFASNKTLTTPYSGINIPASYNYYESLKEISRTPTYLK